MLKDLRLEHLLMLDIETIPAYSSFDLLPVDEQELWCKKAHSVAPGTSAAIMYNRAGIYAEFGRIICISTGHLSGTDSNKTLVIRSFTDTDETVLLQRFCRWLERRTTTQTRLCAHNGKEFDFPWLTRRMIIRGITLPRILDTAGKKPWEVNHIDTLELWKFGDYKHYTSLSLLAHIFGIPSPKSDMDGSMVAESYYVDKDIKRIRNYCEQDVATLTQVMLRFKSQPLLAETAFRITR